MLYASQARCGDICFVKTTRFRTVRVFQMFITSLDFEFDSPVVLEKKTFFSVAIHKLVHVMVEIFTDNHIGTCRRCLVLFFTCIAVQWMSSL